MLIREQVKAASLFTIAFLLTVCLYVPALGGFFVFDDYHVIANNTFLSIEHISYDNLLAAAVSGDTGPLKRPVAMLSFAINHVFTGMDTWWMKVTNLSIHLFNGVLVLLLTKCLYRRYSERNATPSLLPYYLTAIWLIHPINVTAVSYIVQRMTSLSATFVLLAIYCYLLVRESTVVNGRRIVLSFSILFFWLLGMLTKETAILLSIYIFVIEWCVYGFRTESTGERRHLLVVWVLLAIPWIGALFYSLYDSSFLLDGYRLREFSASERMYTELRVVMDYFRYMIIPDIRYMGLYHDNIVISKSLFSPMTSLLSMLTIAGLLGLALRVRNTAPLFCLGILWFFGGHVLESTIYPLEIKFFHRNYLPSIGLIIAAADIGTRFYRNYRSLIIIVAALFFAGFSFSTRSLNHHWSSDFSMRILEAVNNPDSIRANIVAGEVARAYASATQSDELKLAYRNLAIKHFEKIRKIDENNILGELGIMQSHMSIGQVPPPLLIERVIKSLPVTKPGLGVISVYEELAGCFTKSACPLKPDDLDSMTKALLLNQQLEPEQRHRVLVTYARYLEEYRGDTLKAIGIMVEAMSIAPLVEDFMLLSLYYEKISNHEQMKRSVDMLQYLDEKGFYSDFIREARARMAEKLDQAPTEFKDLKTPEELK